MSAEEQDITTDETEAPAASAEEAAAEDTPAEESATDEAVDGEAAGEPVAEAPAAEGPEAEEPEVEEPVAEGAGEESVSDDGVDEPLAEEEAGEPVAEEPATAAGAFGPVRVARVYVCERGHRTTTLWGEPDNCQARPTRSGPECGLKLYHITDLPEQVQKALNPLKASKKASKKK